MHFIVGLDRGRESTAALELALGFADAMDADITAVHAVDPDVSELLSDVPITTLGDASERLVIDALDNFEARAAELLASAESVAGDHGRSIETAILYGDPVSELTTYAEEVEADVLFVGHRGRSARMDRIVGSTARGIVERAGVPVLVVR